MQFFSFAITATSVLALFASGAFALPAPDFSENALTTREAGCDKKCETTWEKLPNKCLPQVNTQIQNHKKGSCPTKRDLISESYAIEARGECTAFVAGVACGACAMCIAGKGPSNINIQIGGSNNQQGASESTKKDNKGTDNNAPEQKGVQGQGKRRSAVQFEAVAF